MFIGTERKRLLIAGSRRGQRANHEIAQNSDYSMSSFSNLAAVGGAAVLYLIGSGPITPPRDDGVLVPASPLSWESLHRVIIPRDQLNTLTRLKGARAECNSSCAETRASRAWGQGRTISMCARRDTAAVP